MADVPFLSAAELAIQKAEQAEQMLRAVLEQIQRGEDIDPAEQLREVDAMRDELRQMRAAIEDTRRQLP